jgi:hypothetical protein
VRLDHNEIIITSNSQALDLPINIELSRTSNI